MSNQDDFNYLFTIKDDDGPSDEFEDIISDSGKSQISQMEDLYSISTFAQKGRYSKKKHGFIGKISRWWRKRRSWQKASIITAVSVILIFSCLFGILKILFNYNYNSITNNPDELGFENVLDKNIVNVALFGLDTRDKDSFKGNSDSIMILSLNTSTKKVKIISLMRDTLVPITYNGKTTYGKINSAYSKGGPELAIKTINTIFGLDISEYATVNFYGMADIIDAVGGIDAELTQKEVAKYDGTQHSINGCIYEICNNLGLNPKDYYIFKSGKQHLNGIQAVAYSRIRYVSNIWGTNNDFGRTDRQRYVMEQLFNSALTLEKTQYVKFAKSLIPCSETSLSYTEIMGLAVDILLDSPTFQQARVPQDEYQMTAPRTSAGSVIYFDLDFASKLIHSFIYDDITPDEYIAENGVEKNDWYSKRFSSSSSGSTNTTSKPSASSSSSSSSSSASSLTSASSSVSQQSSSEGSGVEETENDKQSNSETSEGSTPDYTEHKPEDDVDNENQTDEENTPSKPQTQDPETDDSTSQDNSTSSEEE